MKKLILILVLGLLEVSGYSQKIVSVSNPLEEYFQKNYDSTIFLYKSNKIEYKIIMTINFYKKINKNLGLYYFNPKGMSTNKENNSWKQEEEKEIFKLNMLKQKDLQTIYDNYIKDNFTQEWSPENRFICYYFKDNTHRADSYYAGCIPSNSDYKIEFHEHSLIGFTDSFDNINDFLDDFRSLILLNIY